MSSNAKTPKILRNDWTVNQRVIRTVSIIRQLSLGRILRFSGNEFIAMGENLTIGLGVVDSDTGDIFVSPFSDMSFRELDTLCQRHGIGPVIPDSEGNPP